MIRVHVMYPYQAGARFDIDYYCQRHMPLVRQRLGEACVGHTVDAGLAGGAPGQPPPYLAIGTLLCTSLEAFQAAFGQHGAEIKGDIPNYTDIQPVRQISDARVT